MTEKKVYQDVGTFVSAEMSPDKKRVIVKFTPTTGKFAGQEFSRSAFVTALDETSRSTIKSLAEGEPITIDTVVNGNFRNLQGITKGHKEIKKSFKSTGQTSNNDYNQRAARGQALTLATQFAIAAGKGDDDSFILSQVGRFLNLSETVQEAKDVRNINPITSTQTTNAAGSSQVQPPETVATPTARVESSAATTPSGTPALEDDLSDLLDL